jgi:hypothetical protein
VDVGDSWSSEYQDQFLGTIVVDVEIVAEEQAADGTFVFVVEFGGTAGAPPDDIDFADAVALTNSLGDQQGLGGIVPPGATGTVAIRSASVDGVMRFDPSLGIAVEFESLVSVAMDFGFQSEDETADFSFEAGTFRSFALSALESAAPFQVVSILDRFESDPFSLAAEPFGWLTGYDFEEVTDAEADLAFDPLFDVRQDLFAGASILRLTDDSGEAATTLVLTTGGEFRGAPFVAEEVAAFLSGTRPRSVAVGDRTAYRVSIGSNEWLIYNNETHLFVAIGPRDLSQRILSDFAAAAVPYLWQVGDCLDFVDEFDSDTPYAPFGRHGLRHCMVEHGYEVIHSEVLTEGPRARFPSDLPERSEATCGRAFFDFAGTSELESALSMIRYLPDRDEWEKGSRYFACIVFISGPDGRIGVEGRIDGHDPQLAFGLDVGTCLFSLFPVECEDPHNGEVIAVFDFPHAPDAPMPDADDLQDLIDEQCASAFADFVLGSGPGTVEIFDITGLFGAWEFGVRRYYCMAVAFGDGGLRLDVTGTFAGGWEEAEERVSA